MCLTSLATCLLRRALLVYVKVFKYVGHLPLVRRLFAAIDAATKDMAAFVVVFLLVMLAFSFAFNMGFGLQLYHYRGIGTTFMTLIRFALGDVDVSELLFSNPWLGTVLVVSFTFLIYLQLIGIAVAVLLRCYMKQPSDKRASGEWIEKVIEQRNALIANVLSEIGAARAKASAARDRVADKVGGRHGSPTNAGGSRRGRRVAVGGAGGRGSLMPGAAGGMGWITAESSMTRDRDPMSEAEGAFMEVAQTTEQKAVAETVKATERLKALYLEVADGQSKTMASLEQVRTVIRAVTDENFAIAAALRAKGVALPTEQDPTVGYLAAIVGADRKPTDAPEDKAEGRRRRGGGAARAAAVSSDEELARYLQRGSEQGNQSAVKGLAACSASQSR